MQALAGSDPLEPLGNTGMEQRHIQFNISKEESFSGILIM